MAATKTAKTLLTSQALAASTAVNATEWDMTTAYGGSRLFVKLTNGASAPTTAPVVQFFSGEVTGKKRLVYTASGDTVNSSVNDISCVFEQGDMYVNCTITNGATNSITVEAYGQEATTI